MSMEHHDIPFLHVESMNKTCLPDPPSRPAFWSFFLWVFLLVFRCVQEHWNLEIPKNTESTNNLPRRKYWPVRASESQCAQMNFCVRKWGETCMRKWDGGRSFRQDRNRDSAPAFQVLKHLVSVHFSIHRIYMCRHHSDWFSWSWICCLIRKLIL